MSDMPRRALGKTGLHLTPVGLGCAPLGNLEKVENDKIAVDIIHTTFQSGINFLDTAPLYGNGASERRVGLALRELTNEIPDDFVLNTKVGYRPDPFDYSEAASLRCVERSLTLLGLDRIDMVHIHDVQHSNLQTVMNGSLRALQRLRDEGVVSVIGVAGGRIKLLREYIDTGEFDSVMTHNRFNLLNQPAVPLLDHADKLGVALINGAPYASGLLARPLDDSVTYVYRNAPRTVRKRAQTIAAICKAYEITLPVAATQFSTRDCRVDTTVVGASSPQQIRQTATAIDTNIPAEFWEEIGSKVKANMEDDIQGIQPQ